MRQRHLVIQVFAAVCAVLAAAEFTRAEKPARHDVRVRETHIRAGATRQIVSVRPGHKTVESVPTNATAGAGEGLPYARPRVAGFSPLIAITTSDRKRGPFDDSPYEHTIEENYVGNTLNAPADQNFVIGFLDSGADVDLAAGSYAQTLGLVGERLTSNTIELGGVGGSIDALITQPLGFFAAGLDAVNAGVLDLNALVGHSNVAGVAPPPIQCGTGETVTAIMGTSFMSFHNFLISVDTQHTVTVGGETFTGPDVQIYPKHVLVPDEVFEQFTHALTIEFGGLLPATTAGFMFDFEDLETPISPTLMSFIPGSLATGGAYFASLGMLEGEPGPLNPIQTLRVLVDTGAQSSIISSAVAANLNLPFDPDFTVDVCGVGGTQADVPGYYIDFVRISAIGGALEFSQVPLIVLDLQSPEGGALDGIMGMNLFWDRNILMEPDPTLTGFVYVSDPIAFALADNDLDFDVDLTDAATLAACVSGPSVLGSPDCIHFDADEDMAVDLSDYAGMLECLSGSGVNAEPLCGF